MSASDVERALVKVDQSFWFSSSSESEENQKRNFERSKSIPVGVYQIKLSNSNRFVTVNLR